MKKAGLQTITQKRGGRPGDFVKEGDRRGGSFKKALGKKRRSIRRTETKGN